jgi:hypothetical protein
MLIYHRENLRALAPEERVEAVVMNSRSFVEVRSIQRGSPA